MDIARPVWIKVHSKVGRAESVFVSRVRVEVIENIYREPVFIVTAGRLGCDQWYQMLPGFDSAREALDAAEGIRKEISLENEKMWGRRQEHEKQTDKGT